MCILLLSIVGIFILREGSLYLEKVSGKCFFVVVIDIFAFKLTGNIDIHEKA